MTTSTRHNLAIVSACAGLLIGSLVTCIYAESHITRQGLESVTCVEHVTTDETIRCALFEFQGDTYATDYAPTYEISQASVIQPKPRKAKGKVYKPKGKAKPMPNKAKSKPAGKGVRRVA